ncbi:unnamed protein product [Urochloa humidicola]
MADGCGGAGPSDGARGELSTYGATIATGVTGASRRAAMGRRPATSHSAVGHMIQAEFDNSKKDPVY